MVQPGHFYHMMIFTNQTLEDITNDYFSEESYTCIENIQKILFSYYELRKKRKKIEGIYKTYSDFCNYDCQSLYDYITTAENEAGNTFPSVMKNLNEKYNINTNDLKQEFVKSCGNTQSFIGSNVTPALQSLYQKVTDSMILLKNSF